MNLAKYTAPLALIADPTGAGYDAASHTDSTRRAYSADVACWLRWLAGNATAPADASPAHVCAYLAHLADKGTAAATIDRRLVAIRALYRTAGIEDPTAAETVRQRRRGIRRTIGTAQNQAAPILSEDLTAMLDTLGSSLAHQRDRAILLLGFGCASRRSELASLDFADLAWSAIGLQVTLRRSKTDQEGKGRTIVVLFGRTAERCPVRALRAWMDAAGIEDGPIFRSINRHGAVGGRLTDKSINLIVKRVADAAGLDTTRISGHSLRAGLATAAALAGADERSIMRQTGHTNIKMVQRYIRIADLWTNNAAARVL